MRQTPSTVKIPGSSDKLGQYQPIRRQYHSSPPIRNLLATIKENQSGDWAGEKRKEDITDIISGQVRGIGTDVAIVSAMVFLAQFILSSLMGSIVQFMGEWQIQCRSKLLVLHQFHVPVFMINIV